MTRARPARRALGVLGVGAVIVVALVVILAALRTELPRSPGVMSDALGPDPGEPVAAYLDRAADSLDEDADGARRWALVNAERALSVSEAAEAVADLPRVSGLYVQVPLRGVAMPVTGATLVEPVAAESTREPVFDRVLARRVAEATRDTTGGGGRVAESEALTAARVRAGEPSIIALVVRGATADLRAVARTPAVRAVEALPADAVWGRFAVRPLLPQQVGAADPLPDHAPLPPS